MNLQITRLIARIPLWTCGLGPVAALLITGIFGLCSCTSVAAENTPQQPINFAREVLPILSNKCFACHGPDADAENNLRLDSFAAATELRDGIRAIDPENLADSLVLTRIHSSDDPMPPEYAEKQLTDSERDILTRWIEQGGEYATHWAYVAPIKPDDLTLPSAGEAVIDHFITAGLQQRGIAPAESADRATLARRAALVLIGLPPEPELLTRFLEDESDLAYDRYLDALFNDVRFGEHQARYWLDAVRYGDTHGLHLDNRRGIYPYRDWVVRAFNQNLPLDDFIRWQVAGDLLPNPSLEQLTATGFVRMNPSTGEGGAIPDEFQAKNNFDRTETLGTVLLGTSLTCARCHTHKYDPIVHDEYYQLMAFFNSTAEPPLDGNSYTYGDTVQVPKDQQGWDQWQATQEKKTDLLAHADAKFANEEDLQALIELASDLASSTETEGDAPWTSLVKAGVWNAVGETEKLQILSDSRTSIFGDNFQQQAAEVLRFEQAREATFTTTLIARELDSPRETFVLKRGEYDMPIGDAVEPGVPAVLGDLPENAPRNRLGLAAWLTAPDHPLVARVLVNRMWQHVFGYGLVRTPEDFGLQGEQPTHPELLDWLAVELIDSQWDLKHMLRLMVKSKTFQQDSKVRSNVDDPENRLWARGPSFRLDAEVIRDLGLWASQLLNPDVGGEGVKPYQPSGMWKALAHPGSNTKEYVQDSGPLLYRRSLYVYWKRTSPHPMMTLFDAPDRETSCVRRTRTSTSLQSLGMFNETQRVEMGRKLAERLMRESDSTSDRIENLFVLLASRKPNDREVTACQKLLERMVERYADAESDAVDLLSIGDAPRDQELDEIQLAAWTQVCITVLASDIAILTY